MFISKVNLPYSSNVYGLSYHYCLNVLIGMLDTEIGHHSYTLISDADSLEVTCVEFSNVVDKFKFDMLWSTKGPAVSL